MLRAPPPEQNCVRAPMDKGFLKNKAFSLFIGLTRFKRANKNHCSKQLLPT